MTPRLFALALLVHVLALCGWIAQLGAGDPPPPPPHDAPDVQDLVFLGPSRPVLIRLHVTVDGKPFRAAYEEAWGKYVKKLFALLDRDGDGRLSQAEAERMPPPQMFFTAGLPGLGDSPVNVAFNFSVVDADGDGSVSPDELAAYFREQTGTAFASRLALLASRDLQNPAAAPRANQDLFRRLDRDLDGKLSKAEIAAAVSTLRALDLDEDELVTAQELNPTPAAFVAVPRQPGRPAAPTREAAFLVAVPGEEASLAWRMMVRYTRAGTAAREKRVLPEDLALPRAEFDRLDADHDGKLDLDELGHVRQLTPAVELKLTFGRGPGTAAAVEVIGANPLGVTSTAQGSLLFTAEGVRVEFVQNQAPTRRLPADGDAYRHHFQETDANRDGRLSAAEAKASPFFGKLFSLLDRDGDGTVTMKETEDYLAAVQEEQFLALASRVQVLMSEPGQGLFDLADRNNDGRLSQREIRDLAALLATLDADGDGFVTPAEVPATYRLAVGLGQASFNRYGGNVVSMPPPLPGLETPDLARGGPLWFRKMDRNHDGEVSRREFLGTSAEFDRLDLDGDGLISAEEAAKAGRR